MASPGVFYRSCNFCGRTTFRVFKPAAGSFPAEIYSDSPLTYPDVGKRLKLQYLECCACRLVCINPLTVFGDIDKHSFEGERNIVAWADLDYRAYEDDKRSIASILYEQYEFERYRQTNRVLDVSCGPGVTLSWLRDEKGWEPHGIDPDRFSVQTARERYGLTIANGLIGDVDAPDEHFDLIVMDSSLEHTFDPLGALLTAFRLLRKGGMLIVFVPNADSLLTRIAGDNAHWGHWFFYRPQVLVAKLQRIGFRAPRVIAIQNPVDARVLDAIPDLGPYEDGLRVDLRGEDEVAGRIAETAFYADYFNLAAVKPEGAPVCSPREAELSQIAAASKVQHDSATILVSPRSEARPARAWRRLQDEHLRPLRAKAASRLR